MFAKDVSKYCRANVDAGSVAKCKHDLLQFGVEKLEKMSESHLDAMDPYQRSANDISKFVTNCKIVCCCCLFVFNIKKRRENVVSSSKMKMFCELSSRRDHVGHNMCEFFFFVDDLCRNISQIQSNTLSNLV